MKKSFLLALLFVVSGFRLLGQNSYQGFYGEGSAGGIYLRVNGGVESAPAPAILAVASSNLNVYAISSISGSITNWLSVGGQAYTFIGSTRYNYFDPSSSGYTPSTQISNLYNTTLVRAWFSTNASGIWFIRATNTVIVGNTTNVYRLEVSKTREPAPALTNPGESPSNYIVYVGSDPQFVVGTANGYDLQFQWQKSSSSSGPYTSLPVNGYPTPTNEYIQFTNCVVGDAGFYRKIIFNSSGSITSTWAQLTVNTPVPSLSFTFVSSGLTNRAGYPSLTGNGASFGPAVTVGPATKNWGYWRKNGVPTPFFSRQANGVTVSSPYLYRAFPDANITYPLVL